MFIKLAQWGNYYVCPDFKQITKNITQSGQFGFSTVPNIEENTPNPTGTFYLTRDSDSYLCATYVKGRYQLSFNQQTTSMIGGTKLPAGIVMCQIYVVEGNNVLYINISPGTAKSAAIGGYFGYKSGEGLIVSTDVKDALYLDFLKSEISIGRVVCTYNSVAAPMTQQR